MGCCSASAQSRIRLFKGKSPKGCRTVSAFSGLPLMAGKWRVAGGVLKPIYRGKIFFVAGKMAGWRLFVVVKPPVVVELSSLASRFDFPGPPVHETTIWRALASSQESQKRRAIIQ